MKIIGFKSQRELIVEMQADEFKSLLGFECISDLNNDLGFKAYVYSNKIAKDYQEEMISLGAVDVSGIYQEAKDILDTYSGLKSKLESIRNQITTLTKAMATYREIKEGM